MAIDFSRFNFFKRLDARARVLFLLGAVIGVIFLIYLLTRLLGGGATTTGPSRVANAPQGLQSVPGGQLSPEYQRAVMQANTQAAQQAQMTGGSAVPTLINIGGQPSTGASGCIICSDQNANVKTYLDDWVRQGKLSPEIANALQSLADKNVGVEDYAAELDRLVREGKLTPEQARMLLEQYKKQHANALLDSSAKAMDAMIKSGQLPVDVANQLLEAQKNNASPSDYAAMLQDMVRQGKLTPEQAQQLLAQYSQQRAKEIVMKSIASLHQMARKGEITPDVENDLIGLENAMVPVDAYAATLQKYVSSGKMTPAVAGKILDEFKSQKAAIGPTESVNQLLEKAEAEAYGEIQDLMREGKMTKEVGALLTGMIQRNVPLAEYQATINQLVQENKMTPDIAKLKMADYQKVKQLRALAQRLAALQGNNASPNSYADELKKAVQAGALSPEEAARLLQEYQAMMSRNAPVSAATAANVPGGENFAQLQQRVMQGAAQPTVPAAEFAAAQAQASAESAQARAARLETLATAMAGQAQQLISSWQPVTMVHRAGVEATKSTTTTTTTAGTGQNAAGTAGAANNGLLNTGPPIIKAGSILFAVLDTAVNSDYPDSPVMATIVDGKYKGAKLLGKLTTTKSVTGQMDRISLNFTLMNMDEWEKGKSITAYAIDPDTARTVLASDVDYHYMQRFGAMMATSFLQGYAQAITNEGTSTTGIFGTSTSHPELSPTQKLAVALGQMGQTLGTATQNYINRPPTVVVDSGVGLGILFMSDVT